MITLDKDAANAATHVLFLVHLMYVTKPHKHCAAGCQDMRSSATQSVTHLHEEEDNLARQIATDPAAEGGQVNSQSTGGGKCKTHQVHARTPDTLK